jgi:hypothetical protein
MWDLLPGITLGAIYRSGPKFEVRESCVRGADNDSTAGPLLNPSHPNYNKDFAEFTLKIPDSFGVGIAIRPIDTLTFTIDVLHIRYQDLLEDFDPLIPGPKEIDGNGRVEYSEANFTVDNATEFHLGVEYILSFGKRLLAFRAGIYNEPDHTIRYTGTTGYRAADVFQRAWFPGGKDQIHFTGGMGIVFNEHFQIDTASNISENNTQFSVSAVYRF